MRLSEFRDALRQEIGDQLYDFIGDKPFERWINVGQRILAFYAKNTAQVSWTAGATSIPLPADWHHVDKFVPAVGCDGGLPPGQEWGTSYVFSTAARRAGSGTFFYYANRPNITGSVPSTLDDECNEALISYALYRFFKRIASSRSDYRMYATITNTNGVDISQLDDLSERHKLDFDAVKDTVEPLRSTTFYD